jgi:hypothetical protein
VIGGEYIPEFWKCRSNVCGEGWPISEGHILPFFDLFDFRDNVFPDSVIKSVPDRLKPPLSLEEEPTYSLRGS